LRQGFRFKMEFVNSKQARVTHETGHDSLHPIRSKEGARDLGDENPLSIRMLTSDGF